MTSTTNFEVVAPLSPSTTVNVKGIPEFVGSSTGITYKIVTDQLTASAPASTSIKPYNFTELFTQLRISRTATMTKERMILSGNIFLECNENVVIKFARYVNGVLMNETNAPKYKALRSPDVNMVSAYDWDIDSTPYAWGYTIYDDYVFSAGDVVEYRVLWAASFNGPYTVALNRSFGAPNGTTRENGISTIILEGICAK